MSDSLYGDEIIKRALVLKNRHDLQPLIEKIKNKKVVMLGEASHGTQEFYEWRQLISRELITHYGFKFIAVEGDWPACEKVNRYIKNKVKGTTFQALKHFSRWPTWMWANTDVIDLMDWMKEESHAGFYGLDIYSLFESAESVIRDLHKIDPDLAQEAAKQYSCFERFVGNEDLYVRSLVNFPQGCREEANKVLSQLLKFRWEGSERGEADLFNARQNARIVKNSEQYFNAMVTGSEDSWNVRDRHMLESLDLLLKHYGPETKAIVWAHNSHIGDYRATDMVVRKEVNLGGLAREKYGDENVSLVGFSTYQGSVIASRSWDGPIEVMKVPPAKEDSVEDEFHRVVSEVGSPDFFILMDEKSKESQLNEYKQQRAIGVIYQPHFEQRGNYVPTALANRYNAFLFFDKTHALTPLKVDFDRHKIPDTYPIGR